MNFTDFYPIYSNPKLGTFEIILHIPGIIIAPINIFFCSIFVVLTVFDVNRFHINFWLVTNIIRQNRTWTRDVSMRGSSMKPKKSNKNHES